MTREQALEAIHNPHGPPSDPQQEAALEAWLDRDPELRELRDQQAALFEALDDWKTPEPSASFDRHLYARIEAARTPWYAAWLPRTPAPRWAAAALAAVLLAGAWMALTPTADIDTAPKTAVANDEYFDELDQALDDLEMLVDFDVLEPAAAVEGRS